jgi:iron(II)-dependent oxidoreductase
MMIRIPAGWFWMGSEGRFTWESPRHRVFTDSFEIGATTVTRDEYSRFLLDTGHPQPRGWTDPAFSSADQPVVGVNWFDAEAYCAWLSSSTGSLYRLPSEAEWERAARGERDETEYAWGDEPPETLDYFRQEWSRPRPVTEGPQNGFGLFHMGDNVHEWCTDWFAPDYYAASPERNPPGPEQGSRRVSRGGSWRHQVKASRLAHRSSLPPEFRYTDYGFRIVRTGPPGCPL